MSATIDEQAVVKDFLGERPEAAQLREWREVLEQRLRALVEEQRKGGPGAESLGPKILKMRKQVDALRQEEAITEFVEESVRVTLNMGAVADIVDDPDRAGHHGGEPADD